MKRKSTELLKEIYNTIKKNSGITLSQLERKIGTNPTSLKEDCELLEYFKLVKIERKENTTIINKTN